MLVNTLQSLMVTVRSLQSLLNVSQRLSTYWLPEVVWVSTAAVTVTSGQYLIPTAA